MQAKRLASSSGESFTAYIACVMAVIALCLQMRGYKVLPVVVPSLCNQSGAILGSFTLSGAYRRIHWTIVSVDTLVLADVVKAALCRHPLETNTKVRWTLPAERFTMGQGKMARWDQACRSNSVVSLMQFPCESEMSSLHLAAEGSPHD